MTTNIASSMAEVRDVASGNTKGAKAERTSPIVSPKRALLGAVEDVVYGSVAGIAGKFIEYPFDTVKVRLQSQPSHLPLRYTGAIDCFQQGWRADGFAGLYRGISAPLVGAALENSSLFLWEQLAQKGLFASGFYRSDTPLPLSALWLTGAISGAFTSLVLTPVELVKCKMQVPVVATTDGMVTVAPTPSSIIREVFRHQGLKGFWNGQMGTLIRETGGCAAWFGSKETVTMAFRNHNASRPLFSSAGSSDTTSLPLWQQALAGATAGAAYNVSFFPADTIKSRMQTAESFGASQPNFWKEGAALWKQHGVRGMYRGCGITVARSAPSSAFIFIIYDSLKANFPLN